MYRLKFFYRGYCWDKDVPTFENAKTIAQEVLLPSVNSVIDVLKDGVWFGQFDEVDGKVVWKPAQPERKRQ